MNQAEEILLKRAAELAHFKADHPSSTFRPHTPGQDHTLRILRANLNEAVDRYTHLRDNYGQG